MTELFEYICSRYAYAQANSDRFSRETFFSQAFGAVEFYLRLHPEHTNAVERMWEKLYAPKFNALVEKAIR